MGGLWTSSTYLKSVLNAFTAHFSDLFDEPFLCKGISSPFIVLSAVASYMYGQRTGDRATPRQGRAKKLAHRRGDGLGL